MMKVAEVEAPPARAPARRGWSVVATACAGALVALSLERCAWAAFDAPSSKAKSPRFAVVIGPSRAATVLGELSAAEVRRVASWAGTKGFAPKRDGADATKAWLSGPSAVEVAPPAKALALAYLDGESEVAPPRYARVTAVVPLEEAVVEYVCGPLQADEADWTFDEVERVPFSKRPTEPGADQLLAMPLLEATIEAIGADVLEGAFGPVFPTLAGFDAAKGEAGPMQQNDPLSPVGVRRDVYKYSWTPPAALTPRNVEATWVHPMPLKVRLDATAPDAKDWFVVDVGLCGAWYANASAVRASPPSKADCGFTATTGSLDWEVPSKETPASKKPRAVAEDHGVTWGPWAFSTFVRTSQGPTLGDVRFKGERILYELSLQDAMAAYSGDETEAFFYSDAASSRAARGRCNFTLNVLEGTRRKMASTLRVRPEGWSLVQNIEWTPTER